MSNVLLKPFSARGEINAQPSKSDMHRAIICAALSKGESVISPIILSDDILATINCIKALGADVKTDKNNKELVINGSGMFSKKDPVLYCNESGSTLRFMIPVAAVSGLGASFERKGRLSQRPLDIYTCVLPEHKAELFCDENGLLKVKGKLSGGTFEVPGNISSQFITGLLFALPLLKEDSDIILSSKLESEKYVDMTISTLDKFGIKIEKNDKGWHIKGNQEYSPCRYTTDGDYSQAAFFLAMGAISGQISVNGLNEYSLQGDKKILDLLKRFGADVKRDINKVTVTKNKLKAFDIDVSQIPDLVPILSVISSVCEGSVSMYNGKRLKLKESDRLKSSSSLINSLGGDAQDFEDGLIIKGEKSLKGGFVKGFNDHRIIMSAAVSSSVSENDIICTDKESINKSYPDFFDDFIRVGGKPVFLPDD